MGIEPVAFLGILLCLQPSQEAKDIRRFVESLGDASVEVREKAQKQLLEIGAAAAPALKEALEHEESEVRIRVRTLLDIILRPEREALHDAAQRPKIPLAAFDKMAGRLKMPTAKAKAALFAFACRKDKLGIVLETTTYRRTWETIEYRIASVLDEAGKPMKIERCGRCGPGVVRINGPGPVRPVIKGMRRWYSEYKVELRNPKNGMNRFIGEFELKVQWPQLVLVSKQKMPPSVLARALGKAEFELKSGRKPLRGDSLDFVSDRPFTGVGTVPGLTRISPYLRVKDERDGWCGCTNESRKAWQPALEEVNRWEERPIGAGGYGLDAVKRITLSVYKPIEEPLEVKGPEIKPK